MRRLAIVSIFVLGLAAEAQQVAPGDKLTVVAPGMNPAAGPARNFTGDVSVASGFRGTGGSRMGGATVTFQPGARSNWHTHPLGQLLIVTEGHGLVQAEGEAVREIKPGDVIWTAPGVKHWHGATKTTSMTHVAVSESVEGAAVQWLEPVTDAVYTAAPG